MTDVGPTGTTDCASNLGLNWSTSMPLMSTWWALSIFSVATSAAKPRGRRVLYLGYKNKADDMASATRLNPPAGGVAVSAYNAPGLMCASLYTSRTHWPSAFAAILYQNQCLSRSRWCRLSRAQVCRMTFLVLEFSSANSLNDWFPVRPWR